MDYRKRREALIRSLDVDAFVVIYLEGLAADRASMTYLTGYAGHGVLLVSREEMLALATTTNIDQARADAPDLEWQTLDWNYVKSIAEVLATRGFRRVGMAAKRVSLAMARDLDALIDAEIIALEDPVGRLREIKDEGEIKRVRKAARVTDEALRKVTEELRVGMSER